MEIQIKRDILFAGGGNEQSAVVLQTLKTSYNLLIPKCFDDLFDDSFLDASLAVVDCSFAGRRGLNALRSIKKIKPSTPVIFMTSKGSEGLCMNAFKLGARDYFSRPFNAEDLTLSIKTILKSIEGNERFRPLATLKVENSLIANRLRNGQNKHLHQKIEKVLVFIAENYSKELSLDAVAGIASMSKYHFSRIFKEATGMPVNQYLCHFRVNEAKRLLRFSPFTVSEISFAVGYNNLTSFEKTFRSLEGCSPTAYRKNCHPHCK